MTDPRKQAYQSYVREIADRMGLKDWRITIEDKPPENPNSQASIWMAYGQRLARLYLSEAFLNESPEERRDTIVHELVHLHLAPANDIAGESMPAAVKPAYERMFEYAVDALTKCICPAIPLPSIGA